MGRILSWFSAFLFGVVVTYIAHIIGFNHKVSNFDKVLDGSITFSSIVVGFLAALLGILISIRDTEIVKEIFRQNEIGTLKYYFNEALILGFITVILSGILHVVRGNTFLSVTIIFYVWSVGLFWFIASTYRIVHLLMNIFFKSHYNTRRPQPVEDDPDEQEAMRQGLIRDRTP
ncbi:hypothetical protein GVV68_16980 [Bacillus cereus]|uniref:hypothetical protein n=1 Tax=Bacillus cereus group TaxID=86661 RepID=UPI000B42F3C9|nr:MULTISPECIES: hypothetical protein [Bacillus cereus group]OTW89022.1 hypothetical protein BK713_00615 [Bacillus thuringiensis serovar jinghongiensis]OTX24767.1 hypothetical protein BK715_01780 [Bacillus thuringiensis serovar japonensis]WBO75395.1 hypothetical protein GVV68_16980 [Bacillus cereus]